MKKLKIFISLLLVGVMLFGIIPNTITLGATTEEPLKIEVTTDKSSYGAINIATFNVKITNTSEKTIENISAEAVFDELAPVGGNSETKKEVQNLQAGESISFNYRATVNASKVSLNFFQRFFILLVRFFNSGLIAKDNGFNDGRDFIENTITLKFGNNSVKNTIKVWYENKSSNQSVFEEFYANTYDIKVGDNKEAIFTAILNSQDSIEKVAVYSKDGAFICNLYDNGEDYDAEPGDKIFNGFTNLYSEESKTEEYYAEYDGEKSDYFKVRFYSKLTSEDNEILMKVMNDTQNILSKYEETGNTKRDTELAQQAYNEILQYIENGIKEGYIKSYTITSFGFNIILKNDNIYIVSFASLLQKKKSSSLSIDFAALSTNLSASDLNKKIITLQPIDKEDDPPEFDNAARKIASSVEGYEFAKNINNEDVSINALKQLSDYKIIILGSHGGQIESKDYNGHVFLTGERITSEKNELYEGDLGRSIFTFDGVYAVTGDFFLKYYKDNYFNDSIFYLGACQGANNTSMPNALINRGVKTVLAYENNVKIKYNRYMCESIFDKMSEKNNSNLHTVYQAVNYAKQLHGEDDSKTDWTWLDEIIELINPSTRIPSSVYIFGDYDYRLDLEYPEKTGTIDVKIKDNETGDGIQADYIIRKHSIYGEIVRSNSTNKIGIFSAIVVHLDKSLLLY